MKLEITVGLDYAAPGDCAWLACFGAPDENTRYGYGNTKEAAVRDLLDNYDWPEER